jgi:inosine-uridine nucleoside N-ribohydrolase
MSKRASVHLLVVLMLCSLSTYAADKGRKRVIVSTDLGIGLKGGWRSGVDADDGWAVGMALHQPSLDVRLIATVLGNSNVAPEEIVSARLIRDVLRSRVKRARGAAVKLDDPQATFNGAPLTSDCWNPAVDEMQKVLRADHATIVAIGPLTDVGCLVLNAPPATIANLDEVIGIMGRAPGEVFSIGPVIGLTDFNLVMDNRALEVLLQSKVPMTFLQFRLTSSTLVPRSFVEKLKDGTPLQRFFHEGTIPWIDSWQKTFKEDGFHPWDSNAVWYAASPAAYSCADANFVVKTCAKDHTDPYHRLGGCAGHSAEQGPSLDREAIQLWLGPGISDSRSVRTCTDFRGPDDRMRFEQAVGAFLDSY